MSKKPVDFVAAMQKLEDREGVRRHPKPALVTPSAPDETRASPPVVPPGRTVQRSRIGKVSIGVWVDPAVRKQLAQIALDTDKDQGDLLAEGLNLLFEKYGKLPIARVD
jgi:hypothetical protein